MDDLNSRIEYKIKRETLLALFSENMRLIMRADNNTIIEQWKVVAQTINEENIDTMILEEQLKGLIAKNRGALGYDAAAINTAIKRELDDLLREDDGND